MSKIPKVSIVSISYNQEKYIRQTLDGFVMQQTNFDYEIVMSDDCSTDSTAKIINDYAEKYPDIFQPILRKKNVGVQLNLIGALQAAKGDYIALCEGDDYWTVSTKLQQQSDFLDGNTDYALCFHPVKVFFENEEVQEYVYPDPKVAIDFSLKNLLKVNYIQTNSVMYRKQKYGGIPTNILPLDWYLHVYHAQFGKVGFIDNDMAAYRKHPGGMWWGSQTDSYDLWRKHGLEHIRIFVEMLKLYGKDEEYKKIIIQHASHVFDQLIEVDKKYGEDLFAKAVLEFPGDSEAIIIAQHESNKDAEQKLHTHMNEQAKIIEHLENDRDNMSRQYEHAMEELNQVNTELQNIKESSVWRIVRYVQNMWSKTRW